MRGKIKNFGLPCSVEKCERPRLRHPELCPIHAYRLKKWGDIRAERPIGYLKLPEGTTTSSLYRSWAMMKNRCLNPKALDYSYYGGRGIKVCKRWHEFRNFRDDMGDKPTSLHTIGRINVNKGYSLKNCRWETRKQQARSTTRCKLDLKKAASIRKLYSSGFYTFAGLAKSFEISTSSVASVVKGKTWV